MKLGILGGTFNPPHIGHLILAEEIKQKAVLDRILFVPTNQPPHKNVYLAPAGHRLAMLDLAVQGNSDFQLMDLEIKRGGISYTVDTLKALQKIYPEDSLHLIIGSDLAGNFDTWKEPETLFSLAEIIVADRSEFSFADDKRFRTIKVRRIEISSSLIRNLRKEKKSIKYLVQPEVCQYIEKNKLYL